LFETSQLEQVRSEAADMIRDPRYKFVNFERELNEAGYALMRGGKNDEALFVFKLNTDLFPQSANVWDSLGEWHWNAKNKERAVEYYNKAIELDSNGPTGDNARNMLKQINDAK
jgi:tetratricopeptide (TPR) repeat protein